MEPKDLKNITSVLHELGNDYIDSLKLMKEVQKGLHNSKSLWKEGNKSRLIKTGLTLITFPEPTPISETLGAIILAVGLVQNKMKTSALHIEDIYKNFKDIRENLQKIRRDLT